MIPLPIGQGLPMGYYLPHPFRCVAMSESANSAGVLVMIAEMPQDGKQVINNVVEVSWGQVIPEHSWLPQQQLEQKGESREYEVGTRSVIYTQLMIIFICLL